jgi:hypothetical protein
MTGSIAFRKQGALPLLAALAIALLLPCQRLVAQSTVSTGSIQGTITDPSGAAVPGVKVTITSLSTGAAREFTTNSTGFYNSGSLPPGNYKVRAEIKGFRATETETAAQVGNVTTTNLKLQLGSENQTVNVEATSVAVNTEQASVQGTITAQQIDQLPVNGRNFLDLAQLEPGVQIQDGTNFDPTKAGYESISFGGRFGRTARINVDGIDMSDETVGTTTGGLPQSAIQEFQLAQSTLDLSNDLTTSGEVNVSTRSGTNVLHGEAFGLFRSSDLGATLPHPAGLSSSFQRNQYGGRIGGAIIKDKLFFFADTEGTIQHQFVPVLYSGQFAPFSGGYQSPFKENDVIGRVDYKAPHGVNIFYRYSYSQIKSVSTFFADSLQPYSNKNYVRQHVVGADWSSGNFSHSIRLGYMKFQNEIADAAVGSGLPLSDFPGNGLLADIASISVGPSTGPNLLAPQSTPQSNKQVKYDGSKVAGKHTVRYGISFNHIQGGGFADFFGLAPQILYDPSSGIVSNGCIPNTNICGAANPLNYPVALVILGNNQGFSTEKPAFGFPAGGLGPDNRLGLYASDTWRILPNFTLNIGLRYDRDTGRTDSDLPGIPALNGLLPNYPNLGAPIPNPNKNLAPQLGIAWDPWSNGKTAIRAGIGLFYENVIYNNVLFDRPLRLANGAFLQTPVACAGGQPQVIPGYTLMATPAECSGSIGNEAAGLAMLQLQLQAQTPFSLSAPNPGYLVNALQQGANFGGTVSGAFAPNYKTPRSTQMNVGVQHEFKPGLVLSVDYVRNVETGLPLSIDLNHTGDVRFFNAPAANYAINATNASFGCPPGAAGVQCAIGKGATIYDYAGNGLDSQLDLGGTCNANDGTGHNPNTGGLTNPFGCAFGGLNPKAPRLQFLVPAGISKYNALDVKLTYQAHNVAPGLHALNMIASYSLSRFGNCGGLNPSVPGNSDQDFVIGAIDDAHPCRFFGPSLLDRTSQFSFGFIGDIPKSFRVSVIGHFYSPLSTSLVVPYVNGSVAPGTIFQTDFTGSGVGEGLVPGTTVGSFNRSINPGDLNTVINNYNGTVANNPTPAGNVLVQQGLFTPSQLLALGGVAPTIATAPNGEVGLGWLRAFDFKLSWIGKVTAGDHVIEIEPSAALFNIFNFANFDLPPNVLSGLLTGTAGSINGTTYADRVSNRVGIGTGVYGLGAPRVAEFGLRIGF